MTCNKQLKYFVYFQERLNSEDAYPDSLISYARYVNSMLILAEFQFADRYDFILRSDLDCFIAPGTSILLLDYYKFGL